MLENVLTWLTSPDAGAFVAVTWAASWALEEVDAWHRLQPKVRSLAILGLSILLALGATVLQRNPAVVTAIEPYFRPAAYVILAWLATQTAHRAGKALNGGGDG